MSEAAPFTERFRTYFEREVAQMAAKSISNGAEMEIQVGTETFTFTKQGGKNAIIPGSATSPQLIFKLSPKAAEGILAFPSNDIGEIGVHIAKMVIASSKDPEVKVHVQFKAGFLSLFTKGYFGVVATGGAHFASFLASQGLNGIAGIKSFLGKIKS